MNAFHPPSLRALVRCALLLLLGLQALPAPASAQQLPGEGRDRVLECPAPCQGSISCRLCTLKLELYREWMRAVDQGVDRFPLPESIVQTLAHHFPHVDLAAVEVGSTRKQAADGLTDCTRIYLADAGVTEEIRRGRLPRGDFLELFLHELVHVEQCALLGGRDAYALLWFRDLGIGALDLIRSGGGWDRLHLAMPMEAEAAARAAALTPAVEVELEEARER
jgi:hypothetical protein